MGLKINQKVLVSGTDYFDDQSEINPHMDSSIKVDGARAAKDHQEICRALESAGIEVVKSAAPKGSQDGVYTANWGLCRGGKVVLSVLPNARKAEEPYAEKTLRGLGYEPIKPPYRFSGQGDALPCGDLLFAGSNYRTDPRMHEFLKKELGYEVISLQTVPKYNKNGQPVTNAVTGWPDSFFYDIDLALAVLREDLIAWCPEAFMPQSQETLHALPIDKIEVSLEEAVRGFACNLVSTGETVVMSAHAPKLAETLRQRGFKTLTPDVQELGKGGGYIRCCTLTLLNPTR